MSTTKRDVGKLQYNSQNLQYGRQMQDMSTARFHDSMKKLDKMRKNQMQALKKQDDDSEPDFTVTPTYEKHTNIGSKRIIDDLKREACRSKDASAGWDHVPSEALSVAESRSHISASPMSPAKKKPHLDPNGDLDTRLTNFLATEEWHKPKSLAAASSQNNLSNDEFAPVKVNITDLGAFYGSQSNTNFFPGCEENEHQPPPPKWHRYKAEENKSAEACRHVLSDERDQASKYVMNDLINRGKRNEQSDFKRAELQLKREANRIIKIKKHSPAAMKKRETELDVSLPKKPDHDKNPPSTSRRDVTSETNVINNETSDRAELLERAEKYIDTGFKAELKASILKEFVNTKRWHPSERETMTKMKKIIEHWTRVAKQGRETRAETVAWCDDDEKAFFVKVLDQLKDRNQQGEYDPWKMLHTAYLRIDKDTVKIMETMCRKMGKDPGIHVHADKIDFFNTNIFRSESVYSVERLPDATLHPTPPPSPPTHLEVGQRTSGPSESYAKTGAKKKSWQPTNNRPPKT